MIPSSLSMVMPLAMTVATWQAAVTRPPAYPMRARAGEFRLPPSMSWQATSRMGTTIRDTRRARGRPAGMEERQLTWATVSIL